MSPLQATWGSPTETSTTSPARASARSRPASRRIQHSPWITAWKMVPSAPRVETDQGAVKWALEIRQVDNQGQHHGKAREKLPAWIRMDTDKAAAKLVRAVLKRRRVAVITLHGRVVVFLERHSPWLIAFLVNVLRVDKRRHREV